jgi:hypothetical protein
MSARVTFLAALLVAMGAGNAIAACSSDIAEFEKITSSDAATGNLNKGVYRKIVGEMGAVKASCAASRDAEAMHGLAAVKSRHGYR